MTDCESSRVISLLSAAGKVLAIVMLTRLLSLVSFVILETQCCFCSARSTPDVIFVAQLLQEKCREQHHKLLRRFRRFAEGMTL